MFFYSSHCSNVHLLIKKKKKSTLKVFRHTSGGQLEELREPDCRWQLRLPRHLLTFWRRNYFFNFSTLCIKM